MVGGVIADPAPTTEPCVRPFGFAQGMFSPHTAPEYFDNVTLDKCSIAPMA